MEVPKRPNLNDRILMASYNQEKCFRDTGLIVDSLAFDLAYQSNTQSRFSGLQYASQGLSRVQDQTIEVSTAMEYLKTLVTNVVINSTGWDNGVAKPYQGTNTQVIIGAAPGSGYAANLVANVFSQWLGVYNDGIFGVTDKIIPNSYPANTSVDLNNTANLLQQNKNFIASEVGAFFANTYSYATYIPGRTIANDARKIVDSLTFDIKHGGNRQTLTHAIQMFDYLLNRSTITNQVVQTSGAFKFIGTIVDEILTNTVIANTYQTTYLQNTSIAGNVSLSEINYIRDRITDLTNIIENGPTYENVQYNIEPITLTANANSNIVAATNILLANKNFIQGELVAYVNLNWKDLSNGTRNFYTVNEATNVSGGLSIVTFDEKILAVDRPLANSAVSFHQGSYLQTSTHTFEYVGAGTQLINALPYNGGVPIQDQEVVALRGGQIFYTSTDHKGDFRIGDELLISRATGTINGRTFNKSLFAVMTPYILALQ
jgi:hypothetical protein